MSRARPNSAPACLMTLLFFFRWCLYHTTKQAENWCNIWTAKIWGFLSATSTTNPCWNIEARGFNKRISRVSNEGLFIYYVILFWPLLGPPLPPLSICHNYAYHYHPPPPFNSPHVWHDRLIHYIIQLITINTLFHTIIFGHHFKLVD